MAGKGWWSRIQQGAGEVVGGLGEAASQAADAVGNVIQEGQRRAEQAAGAVGNVIQEGQRRAGQAADAVGNALEEGGEGVTNRVRRGAEHAVDEGRRRAEQAARQAGKKGADDALETVRDKVKGKLGDLISENGTDIGGGATVVASAEVKPDAPKVDISQAGPNGPVGMG
ncbi:MAG TPA: hypothetical protein PLK94_03600 [Alphaproteobacteria bacterium]|nr:hypothetical protein [Alphaproteobacteria bacterium]HOO50356.1 hypothetical protein [Alphaproteobacteria bacterium]